MCIQQWIDIVNQLGYDYYILSDKPELNRKILDKIQFYDLDIKFIKSCKNIFLRKIVRNIAVRYWRNATFAHLTTYYHAAKNNIQTLWNIDADDTMFLLDASKTADLLKMAEGYAAANSIENFSLDMHRSNIRGHHWSFGITYTVNPQKWLKIFSRNKSKSWQKKYLKWDKYFNLDWFMTYLKDTDFKDTIATFYCKNLYFAHCSNLYTSFLGLSVYHWIDNRLEYSVLKELFKSPEVDSCPIFKDIVAFDMNLQYEDYQKFYENNVINLEFLKSVYKKWANE